VSVMAPGMCAALLVDDGDCDMSKADNARSGWSPEDKAVVKEAEMFDDIFVIEFLNEEEE
jgi:hypothetical protein